MRLEEIKVGDHLFYTERPYSNYADSLIHIRNVDGVSIAHPICTNYNGVYINETGDNWGNDLPISVYFDERCWFRVNYTKDDGDPAVWMTDNFPLSTQNIGQSQQAADL